MEKLGDLNQEAQMIADGKEHEAKKKKLVGNENERDTEWGVFILHNTRFAPRAGRFDEGNRSEKSAEDQDGRSLA